MSKPDQTAEVQKVTSDLRIKLDPSTYIGETLIFSEYGALKDSNNERIGNGMIQILKNSTNGRFRVLLRSKNDLNIPLLNHYLLPFNKYTLHGTNGITYEGINCLPNEEPKKNRYILILAEQSKIEQLKTAWLFGITENEKILNNSKPK